MKGAGSFRSSQLNFRIRSRQQPGFSFRMRKRQQQWQEDEATAVARRDGGSSIKAGVVTAEEATARPVHSMSKSWCQIVVKAGPKRKVLFLSKTAGIRSTTGMMGLSVSSPSWTVSKRATICGRVTVMIRDAMALCQISTWPKEFVVSVRQPTTVAARRIKHTINRSTGLAIRPIPITDRIQ